jgi:uncharacterized protein YecT (DUF1311 family)
MKLVTWLAAFFIMMSVSASIGASDQIQSMNQVQLMNQQACEKYKRADSEMNRVYQLIMRDYAEDKNFIRKMKLAQRAWIAFRDAHLDSMYPDSDPRIYGSINPMCRCMNLHRLTEDRTNSLREWADGVVEGYVCAGSMKFRK